jgi:glyoxylase-like metal-dependent hydrolase (beta-lactamase superfamily II)
MVRFHAVFLALHHSTMGWVLVDTGYGARFKEASQRLPYRFYRWTTPATSAGTASSLLKRAGVRAENVAHVVITHFHADHIGGLAEFPEALVHFKSDALDALQKASPLRQTRSAFLPGLVPGWLPGRARPIGDSEFINVGDVPFPSHDLFGDGSLRLVSLPGHAPGHVGVIFSSARGRELYAADAFWRACQLDDSVDPWELAMRLQWDRPAYRRTIEQLRTLNRTGRFHITACHDEGASGRLCSPKNNG